MFWYSFLPCFETCRTSTFLGGKTCKDTNFAWEKLRRHQNKHEKVSPSRLNQYWCCNLRMSYTKDSQLVFYVATFGKVRKRPLLKWNWKMSKHHLSHVLPLLRRFTIFSFLVSFLYIISPLYKVLNQAKLLDFDCTRTFFLRHNLF